MRARLARGQRQEVAASGRSCAPPIDWRHSSSGAPVARVAARRRTRRSAELGGGATELESQRVSLRRTSGTP